jgi:DNA-binding CsgD family transcriptional regulator
VVQNLEEMKDTRNQIIHLIKENLQLKNQLRTHSLSGREKQIIKLIAGGQTDKEIAGYLSISPATVKTHRHNIIKKLHLKNKVAIAHFATENGLD